MIYDHDHDAELGEQLRGTEARIYSFKSQKRYDDMKDIKYEKRVGDKYE